MKSDKLDSAVFEWIKEAKQMAPDICDWIGVYFKASYYLSEDSTDLILGPFLGEPTDHTRIPLERGICGLALREEKTANIKNVKNHPEYISCSVETKSELVIPLKDKSGQFIAELDIDSHTENAFEPIIQKKFESFCLTFCNIL